MRIFVTLLKTLFKGLHGEVAFRNTAKQLHPGYCTLYVASRNYETNTASESHEPYITNDPDRSGSFSFLSGDTLSDSIPAILSFELQEMMQGQPRGKKQRQQKCLLEETPTKAKQQSKNKKIFFSDPHSKAREKISHSHFDRGGTLLIV